MLQQIKIVVGMMLCMQHASLLSMQQPEKNRLNLRVLSQEEIDAGIEKKALDALCSDRADVLAQMLDDRQLTCQTLLRNDCLPLYCCALFGSVKCGELLLSRNAFARVYDALGVNLTGVAAINNRVAFLKMLKAHNFSLVEPDLRGNNPLEHAIAWRALDALDYLRGDCVSNN